MRVKVLDVPHQASVNFIVIGNVLAAKTEGIVVTGMLGEGARGPRQAKQKCRGRAFKMIFMLLIVQGFSAMSARPQLALQTQARLVFVEWRPAA